MTAKETILQEIENLPNEFLPEILDHVRRLKLRAAIARSETAIASEAVLARDWLREEEDEAWRDL